MKLTDLKESAHPGGWADIVQFMDAKGLMVSIDKGHPLFSNYGNLKASEVDGHVAGLLATYAYEVLKKAGWFVPGDEQWLLPCSEWVKNYAKPSSVKSKSRR